MAKRIHLLAAMLATLTVATFFLSTVIVELFGAPEAVARVKHWIVVPGLLVLVPAFALIHGTGSLLAQSRQGRLVEAKQLRMMVVAGIGLLVLLPSAVVLDLWAAAGRFDGGFYGLQALELAAGAANLVLMGLNARDGFRLQRPRAPT